VGKPFDLAISFDAKSAGAAINAGQPLPVAAPRSPLVRELRQLTENLAGPASATPKKRKLTIRSLW
jgi:Flp pilus assembly CpaE family ATPase